MRLSCPGARLQDEDDEGGEVGASSGALTLGISDPEMFDLFTRLRYKVGIRTS